MRGQTLLLAFVGLCLAAAVSAEELAVSIDAKSEEDAAEFLAKLNENGAEKNLHFTRNEQDYRFRIALAAESMAGKDLLFGGGADASAAVLTPECRLLFAISRGGRSTKGGAMNALSKEIVKQLEKHLKEQSTQTPR